MIYWDTPSLDSITVPVQMLVQADIEMIAEPAPINFEIYVGGSAFDTLHVFEMYDRTVPFDVSFTASWLSMDIPPSPQTPAYLPIVCSDVGITPGETYYDTITISPASGGVSFTPIGVEVSVTVSESPLVIMTSPTGFGIVLDQGASISGGMMVYESLGRNVSFDAVILHSSSWLTIDPITDPMTPDSVFFTINTTGLDIGLYSDTIVIHDQMGGVKFDSARVPVEISVNEPPPPPNIIVSPTPLEITVSAGGFGYDSLYVFEEFGRHIGFQVESDQAWIEAVWSEVNLFFTPSTVWLYVDARDMVAGIYSANITLISADSEPLFENIIVPVTLTVEEIGPEAMDSVWIATVPGVPGSDVIVPVYLRNFEVLSAINVPLVLSITSLLLLIMPPIEY
jgi:hypothetical protein